MCRLIVSLKPATKENEKIMAVLLCQNGEAVQKKKLLLACLLFFLKKSGLWKKEPKPIEVRTDDCVRL